MERMVVPIYQSGTSRIAILHSEWLNGVDSLSEQELLNLARDVYNKSLILGIPTNKNAIIKKISNKRSFSVQFMQYIPESDQIDHSGNCGNATVASFLYLIELGLVDLTVTAESVNTKQFLSFQYKGSQGNGIELVQVEYLNPIGTLFDELSPTGSMKTEIMIDHNQIYEVSILDAGNPYVWIRSEDISVKDMRTWENFEYKKMLQIQNSAREMLGLNPRSVFPKVAVVSSGDSVGSDLLVRMISVPSWHKTFAITGIVNLCTAAASPGNIINELLQKSNHTEESFGLSVMTPSGLIHAKTVLDEFGMVHSVGIDQKAKKLGGIEIDVYHRIAN